MAPKWPQSLFLRLLHATRKNPIGGQLINGLLFLMIAVWSTPSWKLDSENLLKSCWFGPYSNNQCMQGSSSLCEYVPLSFVWCFWRSVCFTMFRVIDVSQNGGRLPFSNAAKRHRGVHWELSLVLIRGPTPPSSLLLLLFFLLPPFWLTSTCSPFWLAKGRAYVSVCFRAVQGWDPAILGGPWWWRKEKKTQGVRGGKQNICAVACGNWAPFSIVRHTLTSVW